MSTDKRKCFLRHKWHRIHEDDCDFENSHLCVRCGATKVALKNYKWIFRVRWLTFGLGFDYVFKYREFLVKAGPFILAVTRRYDE